MPGCVAAVRVPVERSTTRSRRPRQSRAHWREWPRLRGRCRRGAGSPARRHRANELLGAGVHDRSGIGCQFARRQRGRGVKALVPATVQTGLKHRAAPGDHQAPMSQGRWDRSSRGVSQAAGPGHQSRRGLPRPIRATATFHRDAERGRAKPQAMPDALLNQDPHDHRHRNATPIQ